MSNLFDVYISLVVSKRAIFLFTGLYLLGFISVLFTEMSFLLKTCCFFLLIINIYHVFKQNILFLSKKAITGIQCSQHQWFVTNKQGGQEKIYLSKLVAIGSTVILLRFKRNSPKSRLETLCFLKDNMSAASFHQLLLLTHLQNTCIISENDMPFSK